METTATIAEGAALSRCAALREITNRRPKVTDRFKKSLPFPWRARENLDGPEFKPYIAFALEHPIICCDLPATRRWTNILGSEFTARRRAIDGELAPKH